MICDYFFMLRSIPHFLSKKGSSKILGTKLMVKNVIILGGFVLYHLIFH